MSLHKEGYEIILIAIVVLIIVNVLLYYFVPGNRTINIISTVVSVILLIMILMFFRSPDRHITINENNILASADGKIVAIEEVEETEYFNEKRKQVSIFMSPLDVHINWYPVSGNIKYFKYHPGENLVAWHPKSSSKNERTTVVIENDKVSILVRQIAGTVARRIVYYCKEGDTVTQGDEFGFIKFGSRVDLLLPLNIKIDVELNQKVTGRETVIARFE
ncbi:MAG: phosphatidylserine decarboxylase family protein [Bacteroidota bacterium]